MARGLWCGAFGRKGTVMHALRIIRNILAVVGVLFLCLLCYNKISALLTFPWSWEEKLRVPSPSHAQDFVVYEGNRGAMSSFRYSCFVVSSGERVDASGCHPYDPVLVCERIRPEARWENNSHLIIRFEGGHVFHQRPYSQRFNVAVDVVGGPPLAKSQ